MTRATLLRSVLMVMGFLAALFALAIVARLATASAGDGWARIYDTLQDFTGVLVAIPAAWLAYCFSRRSAFLTLLDAMWRGMVDAKGRCIRYSFDPTPERLVEAQSALSAVIDNMRSVYRNVGESPADIGFFPFEPLHDMRRTIDSYGAEFDRRPAAAERARLQQALRADLTDAWHALRSRFLLEFGAPFPTYPITRAGYRDPRRSGRRSGFQASSSTSQ